MSPVVVVHGGAGGFPKEQYEGAISGVCSAVRFGFAVLKGGGSSMDAVVETVSQLENNPSFNAGCGSVLNIKGDVEMDAMVMDGKTLGSGAVSCVRNIANPIQLARLVMDKEDLYVRTSMSRFVVGETPHSPGSGGYADNSTGAVSSTGDGEYIMRVTLARLIVFYIKHGHSVEVATDLVLAHMKSRVHGLGGVVTVNPQGHWAARFSSQDMPWAAAQNDTLHYDLHAGENFTQSLSEPH